ILCDLEGHPLRVAAEQLGWPPGTVAGRLARGRALLAQRLLRGAQAVTAVVPGALVASTVQAAGSAELIQATVQAPAAAALALAQGVTQAMLWNKVKVAVVAVVLIVVTAGVGGLTVGGLTDAATGESAKPAPAGQKAPSKQTDNQQPAPEPRDRAAL